MKNTVFMSGFILLFLLFLNGCGVQADQSHSEFSSGLMLYDTFEKFDTVNDLAKFLKDQGNTSDQSKKSLYSFKVDAQSNVFIYVAPDELFEVNIKNVIIDKRFIKYNYYLNGYEPFEPERNTSTRAKDLEEKEPTSSSSSALDYSGPDRFDLEQRNRMTIYWDYATYGDDAWEIFMKGFSEDTREFDEYKGCYYTDITMINQNDKKNREIKGKKIYWQQDGYAFQAYVPIEYVDEFMKVYKTLMTKQEF